MLLAIFVLLFVADIGVGSSVDPPELVASEKGISNCLNILNAAVVCSLETKQQSCCAVVEKLDYHGCFCDAIFENLLALDKDLDKLRNDFLPICIPEESHFQNISKCPPTTFLEIQQECQDSKLIEKRLTSIKRFGDTLKELQFKHLDTFEDYVPYFSDIVHEDVNAIITYVGIYSGFQGFVEYMLLSLPAVTKNLMYTAFELFQGWKLFQDGSFGAQVQLEWRFLNESLTLWSREFTQFKFDTCGHKIIELTIRGDMNFGEVLKPGIEKGQWSVENGLCPTIMEHCSDQSLNVSEFRDMESCVAFQRALPTLADCDPSGFWSGMGNTTFCKWKHSFMVPFRPHHHCPHTGTGHISDDHGTFQCVQEDCDHSTSMFEELKAKLSISPDPKSCKLNEQSNLLLHLSSLIDSGCSIDIEVLDEIFKGIPTIEISKYLQGFCQPSTDNDVCPILRLNLQFELSSLLQHCKGAVPESSLPSLHQIIRSASDLSDFQELVCVAREHNVVESKICEACTRDELDNIIPSWIYASTGKKSDDESAKLTSRYCRQTLHFACSNQHGRVPAFCNKCFAPSQQESGYENLSCMQYVKDFWDGYCAHKVEALPNWFHIDAKPYVDPYPGDNPPSDTTDHDLDSTKIFDFIIVGAGNSGCVVARRLLDAGYSVLVLEEGVDWQKNRDLWETTSKRRQVLALWDTPMAKKFISNSNNKLINRPLDIVLGSTVGGSTGINAGLYSRPAQKEFDLYWPEKWKSEDVLPYFKKFENYQCLNCTSNNNHGRDGLLTVEAPSHTHTLSPAWLKAAEKAGIEVILDGASGFNNESGVYQLRNTWKEGRRQDAFTSYLLPIMPHDDLEVRSGANVIKIIYEEEDGKQRATGVVYLLQGQVRVTVHARYEVILSAGWVGSPKILMMSGIGPKDNLEEFDIEVGVPLEGVGQQVVGRPLMNLLFGGQKIAPEEMPWMFSSQDVDTEWALNGTGIFDMSIEDIYGKGKSGLDENGNDDFLMSFSNILGSFQKLPLQSMMSLCKVCRPKSRGSIRLRSPNPFDDPEVSFNMLEDDRDMDVLVACVKKTLSVYKNFRFQGMDLLGLHDLNDQQLRELLRSQVIFSYHAWGSCRMGDGSLDVVEPDGLRVRGFLNLRVIDGSVMPEGPCSGPMATTYMLAERGADFILDDLSKKYVPGRHVINMRFEFIALVSVLFSFMLILFTVTRAVVGIRAKYFSKIIQQPSLQLNSSAVRKSATTAFKDTIKSNFSSISDQDNNALTIHYSALKMTRIPGRTMTLFNATGKINHGLTLLMGSSGAGKSTLLDILSMRIQSAMVEGNLLYSFHQKGKKIVASGSNATAQAFLRRKIAYCKQNPADDFVEELTVFETLLYSYILRVAPGEKSKFANISTVKEVITSVGLTGHESKTVKKLSGGQKRRLQIGTSLIDNPMAIFLDEPTSGLDQNTSLKIIYLMKQVSESLNIPVVAAIHHPAKIVLENADSLYVIFQGYGVFQGNYKDLEEAVRNQESYGTTQCPLGYIFDNIGIDDDFRASLLENHILAYNKNNIPSIQEMMKQSKEEDNNPNTVMVLNQFPIISMSNCTVTLFALFVNIFGSKRTSMDSLLHFARIHCSGLTVFALGVILPGLLGTQLPVISTGDTITFIVIFMVFLTTAVAVFHGSVGMDLVENEVTHLHQLLFERLIKPKHIWAFFVLQGFVITLFSLPGYVVFHFWFGFKTQYAIDAILLFFVYSLQALSGVQAIQLYFPGISASGIFGLYLALQMVVGGALPFHHLPKWLEWARYINPTAYYFSTVLSLEIGVGKDVICGESCKGLLDMYGYESVDLFKSGMFLVGLHILQLTVIYVKLSTKMRKMDQSVRVAPLTDDSIKEQAVEDLGVIEASTFDNVNTKRLFAASLKPSKRKSAFRFSIRKAEKEDFQVNI